MLFAIVSLKIILCLEQHNLYVFQPYAIIITNIYIINGIISHHNLIFGLLAMMVEDVK